MILLQNKVVTVLDRLLGWACIIDALYRIKFKNDVSWRCKKYLHLCWYSARLSRKTNKTPFVPIYRKKKLYFLNKRKKKLIKHSLRWKWSNEFNGVLKVYLIIIKTNKLSIGSNVFHSWIFILLHDNYGHRSEYLDRLFSRRFTKNIGKLQNRFVA